MAKALDVASFANYARDTLGGIDLWCAALQPICTATSEGFMWLHVSCWAAG